MSKDNLEKQVFVKHDGQESLVCTLCGETKHHSNFRKRKVDGLVQGVGIV